MYNMKSDLTVIIPFKNEGIELFNTIKSINSMSYYKNNVIVLNDNSDDNVNYRDMLSSFDNVLYVEQTECRGVAETREHGISLCETEYFVILDAHMRALTRNWDKLILEKLKLNKRAIFCCKTARLNIENNREIVEAKMCGSGVNINLIDLSYAWRDQDTSSLELISTIPCIMGASYSSNKTYWNRINGIRGLRSYGFDEQFLSIKTFLEGGKCFVINDVIFAHKFRTKDEVPFVFETSDFIFNKLYIIELLYPLDLKTQAFKYIKKNCYEETFSAAINLLADFRIDILRDKEYYYKIFNNKLTDTEIFNQMCNKI